MYISTYDRFGVIKSELSELVAETDFDGRIGIKQIQAVVYTDEYGPFESKRQLALAVGPNGSTKYGYEIVDRADRRGLIDCSCDRDEHQYTVELTDEGRELIEQLDEVVSDV